MIFYSIIIFLSFYSKSSLEFGTFAFENSLPLLCSPAKRWTLNGRDLVRDYRGHLLLMSFIPLSCGEKCEKELQKYEAIVEKLSNEVRILVVARQSEPVELVRNLAQRFPLIRFEQESLQSPVWHWLGSKDFDNLIFDRCNRLAKIISHPDHQNLANFHETFLALKSATNYASCGWCQYDIGSTNESRSFFSSKSPPIAKQQKIPIPKVHPEHIKINMAPKNFQYNRSEQIPQAQDFLGTVPYSNLQKYAPSYGNLSPPVSYPNRRQYEEVYEQQNNNPQNNYQYRRRQPETSTQKKPQQPANNNYNHPNSYQQALPTRSTQQYFQTTQQPQKDLVFQKVPKTTANSIQYSQDVYGDRYQYRLGERDQRGQRKFGTSGAYHNAQQRDFERTIKARQQTHLDELSKQRQLKHEQQIQFQQQQQMKLLQEQQAAAAASTAANKNKESEAAPLYPEGSENFDYYEDYADSLTTPLPTQQEQVPSPTLVPPIWPTLSVVEKDYGFDLPCATFTDEICYQQQMQLESEKVHKCCQERILLTDQCFTGKCSNVTQQLCCIQKFLRSKLSCCLDERQLEISEPGHEFSRCCYKHFVEEEDACCPNTYAKDQWLSIHELCLPNVEMDLSGVKVPSLLPGTSLKHEFDFSKSQKWRFECKYGSHVPQFSYFDDETLSDVEENSMRPKFLVPKA